MSVEEAIRKFVENNPQYSIYENYSGRDMFGRTCLGVVVRQYDSFMEFLMNLTRYMDNSGVEDTDFSLDGVSYDSLGLDIIVYFPNVGGMEHD